MGLRFRLNQRAVLNCLWTVMNAPAESVPVPNAKAALDATNQPQPVSRCISRRLKRLISFHDLNIRPCGQMDACWTA
jgi:hypothetical protein